ncbi:hypothetical protein [Iningainema tapete]|uniref:Uncharacterized protein n=1 Tax=Iningainema tapete BLCC-T55 TaxID=2748662 RepID=A0A8J7CE81_9CYAN|nr:hypothetical protein [Iningainema tapete]MBD2773340.1 hypothetical protein [Iningainema tapete BLCC-T55]
MVMEPEDWKCQLAKLLLKIGWKAGSSIASGIVVGVAVTAITSNPAFGALAGKATAGIVGGSSLTS